MSDSRVKLLTLVVILEIAAILGLLTWAFMKGDDTDTKPKNMPVVTYKTPKVESKLFAKGLFEPTDITATKDAKDGSLVVTERVGTVRLVAADGTVRSQPILDLKSVVFDKDELGMLGIALHPKFLQNGYIYVDYTDKQMTSIIARYTVDRKTWVADPKSEKVLLKVPQPYANHKGGGLQFGPDGYLYIPFGDGGNAGDPGNRAQDKTQLLGKILRIDVDHGDPYSVPADNPFEASVDGSKKEIWAYGLRNPWRISFDRSTGDLYIADVGQSAREELNVQAKTSKGGENYGWRCYEGLITYLPTGCKDASEYVMPVLDYEHGHDSSGPCSITGGYVYRGSKYPALTGNYFYGDYCTGEIFSVKKANDKWTPVSATKTDPQGLSTFGENSTGEIFFANVTTGNIYQLQDTAN